ncbi:protein of unknown function [Ralstonia solanacearum PSI07]|nr:protein of unknown function [Ralstonia solanacearum PSI07]
MRGVVRYLPQLPHDLRGPGHTLSAALLRVGGCRGPRRCAGRSRRRELPDAAGPARPGERQGVVFRPGAAACGRGRGAAVARPGVGPSGARGAEFAWLATAHGLTQGLTNTRDVSATLLRLPRNRAYDWRPNSGQPPDLAPRQAPAALEVGEWSHKTLQNSREWSLIISDPILTRLLAIARIRSHVQGSDHCRKTVGRR